MQVQVPPALTIMSNYELTVDLHVVLFSKWCKNKWILLNTKTVYSRNETHLETITVEMNTQSQRNHIIITPSVFRLYLLLQTALKSPGLFE